MKKLIYLALLLQFFINVVKGNLASCPTDYNYVRQIPWDSSVCQSGDSEADCCQALLSLCAVGLAQYLKDSSMFMFPDLATATACINDFQLQLSSIPSAVHFPTIVPRCRNDALQFVSSPNLCDGIQTKQNWTNLLGTTVMDSSCNVDLSDITTCGLCFDGAQQVTSKLVLVKKNATEINSRSCFHFAVIYLAAVSKFGPKNPNTASCAFKLPLSFPKSENKSVLVLIFTSVGAAVIVISGFLIVCMLRTRRNRDAAHRQLVNRNTDLLKATLRPNAGAVWFDIHEIKAATHNFNPANLIGQGSYGMVYKGLLPNGQTVAVKRLKNCSAEGDAEFLNEVEIINNIRHRNLVDLRGCCVASDYMTGYQRFLIYDYMPNGSLDAHLFGGMSKAPLSWPQRKNIVLGTAKGLAYLQGGAQQAIYHRDVKLTNILLDDQMDACVSDFGLAIKMMTKEPESHLTTRVAGTYGYLAPEYALYGQFTDKSDVYSFGIVLMEIMSGRKAVDTSLESASDYLISDWAWKLVKAGKASEVIDEMIRDSGPVTVMVRFVSVGILCAHVMVASRPTIADALKMLEGDIEIPQIPDRPPPVTYRSVEYNGVV